MAEVLVLFQLLLVAYIVSLGFGVLLNGPRGAGAVTRWWGGAIGTIIGGAFRLLGDLLHFIGDRIRRRR